MPIPIRLPVIASDFVAGTIAQWHKVIGDVVRKGDALFDVESDKAVVAVEAEESGVLGGIHFPDGSEDVPINTVVGFLLQDGETEQSSERVFASPLARNTAARHGVEIATISGRGPNGRVLKADVEAAIEAAAGETTPVGEAAIQSAFDAAPSPTLEHPRRVDIPHSKIRKVIAQRLTAAKRDIPHFYLSIDCELDALLDLRRQLNDHFAATEIKISINDCVIKAAALALVDVPAANASWAEDAIRYYEEVDISVAVATTEGLITPIVRNANAKPLSDIAQEMKRLAARAIAGSLKPDEFQGGGFSISNLGMYGIKNFSAIINPPQSCILAIGAGEKRPVVRGDKVEIGTVMSCTLSVDHRSVDGAVGAKLLSAFKKYIESPALLLLPATKAGS